VQLQLEEVGDTLGRWRDARLGPAALAVGSVAPSRSPLEIGVVRILDVDKKEGRGPVEGFQEQALGNPLENSLLNR
jgi:hypothetical protein